MRCGVRSSAGRQHWKLWFAGHDVNDPWQIPLFLCFPQLVVPAIDTITDVSADVTAGTEDVPTGRGSLLFPRLDGFQSAREVLWIWRFRCCRHRQGVVRR